MAKKYEKDEVYRLGAGKLILNAFSGNAHHCDLIAKLNGEPIGSGPTKLENVEVGNADNLDGKRLYVYCRISKTGPTNSVPFTIKLNDSELNAEYVYSEQETENIIKYFVNIILKS